MSSTSRWKLNPGVFKIPKVVSEGLEERRPTGGPVWHVRHEAPPPAGKGAGRSQIQSALSPAPDPRAAEPELTQA